MGGLFYLLFSVEEKAVDAFCSLYETWTCRCFNKRLILSETPWIYGSVLTAIALINDEGLKSKPKPLKQQQTVTSQ